MLYKFDGSDDVFDSRDLLERISEIETEHEADDESGEGPFVNLAGMTPEELEEYRTLTEFRDEHDGTFGDSFDDGVTFIHEDYFTQAMEELCEDIGYLPEGAPDWLVIDWDATADNLRADYTDVEFRGSTYWAR